MHILIPIRSFKMVFGFLNVYILWPPSIKDAIASSKPAPYLMIVLSHSNISGYTHSSHYYLSGKDELKYNRIMIFKV